MANCNSAQFAAPSGIHVGVGTILRILIVACLHRDLRIMTLRAFLRDVCRISDCVNVNSFGRCGLTMHCAFGNFSYVHKKVTFLHIVIRNRYLLELRTRRHVHGTIHGNILSNRKTPSSPRPGLYSNAQCQQKCCKKKRRCVQHPPISIFCQFELRLVLKDSRGWRVRGRNDTSITV